MSFTRGLITTVVLLEAVTTARLYARPVLVGETPGHTRFYIDDTSVVDLPSPDGPIRQVTINSRNPFDPHLRSGQVAAEGVMQFRCARSEYREVESISIGKDGKRTIAVPLSTSRNFNAVVPGRFEHNLLAAACRIKL